MKKIITLFIILNLGSLLQAQVPAKAARQVTKMAAESSLGKAAVVAAPVPQVKIPNTAQLNTPKATVQRPWVQQKLRDLKAYQLHQKRQKRDVELQIQAQALASREALLATLPQANPTQQFTVSDFTALVQENQPPDTVFPLLEEQGTLLRGLALPTDGKAIQNILQNGLRVADAGPEANTLNLAVSGGQRGFASLANHPVTNLTSSPTEAIKWAAKRRCDEKPLLAVVVVNGQTKSGNIVQEAADIPASQITHFFAPLALHEKTVWCNIQLAPNGGFLVTPYNIDPTAP